MKINFGEFEFDGFKSLQDKLESSKPTFSLKQGRRFVISDSSNKGRAFRLNELIRAVHQAVQNNPLNETDRQELDSLLQTFKSLHDTGYDQALSQRNPLTQLALRIKHQFGEILRTRILNDLTNVPLQKDELSTKQERKTAPKREEQKPLTREVYQEKTGKILEKGGVSVLTSGYWTYFQQGDLPKESEPKNLWKLFINPKRDLFPEVLERSLKALNGASYIQGKLISDPFKPRKSGHAAIDDPCEPKLLLYFNGPNSEKDLKEAIKRLEEEFGDDVAILGAPGGERERPDGTKVPQSGPSFTKMRNPLLFYGQGGFTESGKDKLVQKAGGDVAELNRLLSENFEGDNYYLLKGTKDPLESTLPDKQEFHLEKAELAGFYLSKKERPMARYKADFEAENPEKPFSIDALALFLNRSPIEVRAQLLGETYAEVIEASFSEIKSLLREMKKSEVPQHLLPTWKALGKKDVSKDALWELFQTARSLPRLKSRCKGIENALDQKVAHALGVDAHEFPKWLGDVEQEQKALALLAELGEDSNRPLDEIKASQFFNLVKDLPPHSFTKPLALFKLQNMADRIEKLRDESAKSSFRGSLENLAREIVDKMPLQKRHAFLKLYLAQEAPLTALKAIAQNFTRKKAEGSEEDLLKPTLETLRQLHANLESMEGRLGEQIVTAQGIKSSKKAIQFLENLGEALPKTFQDPIDALTRAAIPLDEKAIREKLFEEGIKMLELHPSFGSWNEQEKTKAKTELRVLIEKNVVFSIEKGTIKALYTTKGMLKTTFDLGNQSSWEPLFKREQMLPSLFDATDAEDEDIRGKWEEKKLAREEIALSINNVLQEEMGKGLEKCPDFINGQIAEALTLCKTKVSNLKNRKEEQLQSKAPLLPRYFHAAPSLDVAVSILHTGIEAVEARSGFGAFVSTNPELRYGPVMIGLPETAATSSQVATVFEKDSENPLEREEDIWAGLEENIKINPQQVELEKHLHKNMKDALRKILGEKIADPKERVKLEAKLFSRLAKSLTYRYETLPSGKRGWQLYYRELNWSGKPTTRGISKINSEDAMAAVFETIIEPPTQNPLILHGKEMAPQFAEKFLKSIQQEPLFGTQHIGQDFSIVGTLRESLKATITASDEEEFFKTHYEKVFQGKASKGKGVKPFLTLSEVKNECKAAGLTGKVELIPSQSSFSKSSSS